MGDGAAPSQLMGSGDLYGGASATSGSLLLVGHQNATRGVAFLRYFHKGNHDSFTTGARFFDYHVGEALRQFSFLIGRAALQHGDLK